MPAEKKDLEELLERVKARYDLMVEADEDNRDLAMADMKFVNVPGEQWDPNMKKARGARPCYEFNKLRVSGKRIINNMRANRPAAKVRPVEGGDKQGAEFREGLLRNIWNRSDGESITDYQAEYQVNGGMCAWRITTEYADDDVFEQDIWVRNIENPFAVHCDPSAKDVMKRDAEDWLLSERISHAAFERRFPKAEKIDFEAADKYEDDDDWIDEETVRIAEYWYRKPHEKEIWQLQDGTVVDSESDEARGILAAGEDLIKKRRVVKTHKICWVIANGQEIIEGPTEWAGKHFPFVMVYGEYVVIDGHTYWWGLPRFAKDAQRSYNVARTAISETIAQAPKGKVYATTTQVAGLEEQWKEAHQQNHPYVLYNPDPKAPGPPVRVGGADVPVALIQESQLASDEIKAVTGIFDASIGAKSNETSGRAIYARQQQGEIATFNYEDNMSKGVQRTYEILLDLIPNVYDTERELRVLGADGAENYIRINQMVFDPATGEAVRINDITHGKYDVTVTTGPNFATQRQEAAEVYSELVSRMPEIMGVAGDYIMKSMDLPYADQIADRMKALLPPQIQASMNEGKEIPPEVQQMMAQAQQAMAMAEQAAQQAQQMAVEAEKEQSLSKQAKAEIKVEVANLEKARAEFDTHVAQEMGKLLQKEMGLSTRETNLTVQNSETERARMGTDQMQRRLKSVLSEAIERGEVDLESIGDFEVDDVKYKELLEKVEMIGNLDELLAQFMQAADQAMTQIAQKVDRKPVDGTVTRKNGQLVANVTYDDGTTKEVKAVRDKGQLKIVS